MLTCVCSAIEITSKCGNHKSVAHGTEPKTSLLLMFLPRFDVFCDLSLYRRKSTWYLLVVYKKETKEILVTSSIRMSSNGS